MPDKKQGDLTIAQVAEKLGVHKNSVRNWISEGLLPAYRVGPRTVRIRLTDLNAATVAYKAGGQGIWS
jgi:excisionase family DNA binding protein